MRFAAFFRNLNLGRPPAPAREVLEQVFIDAGAAGAWSFLTNGTLAFEAASLRRAHKVARDAQATLARELGFQEPAFIRRLSDLAALVQRDPFRQVDRSSVYECCVTFVQQGAVPQGEAPRSNRRGDVVVIEFTASEVLSVSRKLGASPGSPNAFVERELGVPASTRSWSTVCRLVERHAA